jgi:hypothetical protein
MVAGWPICVLKPHFTLTDISAAAAAAAAALTILLFCTGPKQAVPALALSAMDSVYHVGEFTRLQSPIRLYFESQAGATGSGWDKEMEFSLGLNARPCNLKL